MTVSIQAQNVLSDTASLLKEIKRADKYMQARYPVAIQTAMAAARDRYETLDPRFNISIAATEKHTHYKCEAKEDIPFTMTFGGPPDEFSQRMESLFGRGLPTTFESGQIEVAGSPLIEDVVKRATTIQIARKTPMAARLIAIDSSDREINAMDLPLGSLEGGPLESRFECHTVGRVFVAKVTVSTETAAPRMRIVFQYSIEFDQWIGKPVLHLPFFGPIHDLFEALSNAASLRIEFSSLGQYVVDDIIPSPDLSCLAHLRLLWKVREIAKRLGLNPKLPSSLGAAEIEEIALLYWMLLDRTPRDGSTVSIKTMIAREEFSSLEESFTREGGLGSLALDRGIQPYPFLGQDVIIGHVVYGFTEMKCLADLTAIQRNLADETVETVPVDWSGTEESLWTVDLSDCET